MHHLPFFLHQGRAAKPGAKSCLMFSPDYKRAGQLLRCNRGPTPSYTRPRRAIPRTPLRPHRGQSHKTCRREQIKTRLEHPSGCKKQSTPLLHTSCWFLGGKGDGDPTKDFPTPLPGLMQDTVLTQRAVMQDPVLPLQRGAGTHLSMHTWGRMPTALASPRPAATCCSARGRRALTGRGGSGLRAGGGGCSDPEPDRGARKGKCQRAPPPAHTPPGRAGEERSRAGHSRGLPCNRPRLHGARTKEQWAAVAASKKTFLLDWSKLPEGVGRCNLHPWRGLRLVPLSPPLFYECWRLQGERSRAGGCLAETQPCCCIGEVSPELRLQEAVPRSIP